MASLIFLLEVLDSLARILTTSQLIWCPVVFICSLIAELVILRCSSSLFPRGLPVSPMYSFLHVLHVTKYITPHFFNLSVLSLGCTSCDLRVLKGL